MVSQQINKMLTERASQFGLILDDISIVKKNFITLIFEPVDLLFLFERHI